MANRYWVGGTGTWNGTNTASWSATSGGAGGASIPTAGDNVYFDSSSSSGSYSVTFDGVTYGYNELGSASIAGPASGTLTLNGTYSNFVVGGTGLTIAATGVTTSGLIVYVAGTGNPTITTNGVLITSFVVDMGSSTDTVTLGSALNTSSVVVYEGTFSTANYTITTNLFTSPLPTWVKVLDLGSSTIYVNGTGENAFKCIDTTTELTVNSGTYNIIMSGGGITSFNGGSKSWHRLTLAGAGPFRIIGSNTFNTLTNTVSPTTVTFTSGITQTFTNFNLSGTSGNLVTINATLSGTAATLSKSSGTVSCDYLSVRDSTATGGATWNPGANSTNVSNNTGWTFSEPPVSATTGNFFSMF